MALASSANQPFGFSSSGFLMSAKKISSSSASGLVEEGGVALLGAQAEMHQHGGVAAVVEDHVGHAAVVPVEQLARCSPSIPSGVSPL